jgi:hypothetical protein
VTIDVVEALCPGARAPVILDLDNLDAEAAPKAGLAAAAEPASFNLVVELLVIFDLVVLLKVTSDDLAAVADLAARVIVVVERLLIAPEDFNLEVLAVLVSLPIVLGSKLLTTPWEGAAVRPLVPLHVLF